MSPLLVGAAGEADGFPRVSGDEPTYLIDTNADIKFSPRERG